MIRKIGSQWGRFIEVETNLFSFLDFYVSRLHSSGLCLISVGNLLFPSFRRIYIPSSHDYAHIDSDLLRSPPALDQLWSPEALELGHDGCEAAPIDNATLIGKPDLTIKSLRVCFELWRV